MNPASFLPGLILLGSLVWMPTVASAQTAGGLTADDLAWRPQVGELALRSPAPEPENDARESIKPVMEPKPFGSADTEYWTIGGGLAHNFDDAWDFNLRGGYGRFLIDFVEVSVEVNAWYFDQEGEDASGINPAVFFRWHLIHPDDKPWTIYTDAGIGLLFATDQVPDGGTWFNFTPSVGIGYTHQIAPDGTRLQLGARWHHISNARISGDGRNPARDGLMVYGGILLPF